MKTAVITYGDTQIGSACALAPSRYEINSESKAGKKNIVSANLVQEYLLECWKDAWAYVKKTCKGYRIITVHIGDILEGNHHEALEVVAKTHDQKLMAKEILQPVANLASEQYLAFGTNVHSRYSQDEVDIARELGMEAEWEWNIRVGDKLLYFTHHGRNGQRPWTSAAAGICTQVAMDRVQHNQPVPNYIFTGHRHVMDDSGEKFSHIRAMTVPCWQVRYPHVMHVNPFTQSSVGLVIYKQDEGLDFTKAHYVPEPNYREVKR